MAFCINKNSAQYQTLKNRSGLSEFILESVCRDFLEQYDRFPYLDELPNSNSEPYLKEQLKVNLYNGVLVLKVLDVTGKESLEEAVIDINNEYRDLEVTMVPINKEALVDITKRPTDDNFDSLLVEQDDNVNSFIVLNNALLKLAKLYGITFNDITDSELNSDKWREIMPESSNVNAFIYDGQIYINIDRNSVDAPIHEMFHILVGSMRFLNPNLYLNLIDSIESLPDYPRLIQDYAGRTRNDANEEILVTLLSKYLSGLPSSIENLDKSIEYEISYNVKRMLDTILMGQDSVKTISLDRLFNMSLKEVALEVGSKALLNNFSGTLNVQGSELHRKLNNVKSELYTNRTLKEQCD